MRIVQRILCLASTMKKNNFNMKDTFFTNNSAYFWKYTILQLYVMSKNLIICIKYFFSWSRGNYRYYLSCN